MIASSSPSLCFNASSTRLRSISDAFSSAMARRCPWTIRPSTSREAASRITCQYHHDSDQSVEYWKVSPERPKKTPIRLKKKSSGRSELRPIVKRHVPARKSIPANMFIVTATGENVSCRTISGKPAGKRNSQAHNANEPVMTVGTTHALEKTALRRAGSRTREKPKPPARFATAFRKTNCCPVVEAE